MSDNTKKCCGSMMVGKCGVCGKDDVPLIRTYFRYPDIKCTCHSPEHNILVDHCKDCTPKEPEYTKVEFRTSDLKNPVAMAMGILKNELAKDKSGGSYYYTWQANIACEIMDRSDISPEQANVIAKAFLDRLIG